MNIDMKVLLSGGGTLGPVVPLLAIVEIYREAHSETQFVWYGTKSGPERELVEKYHIPFYTITAGKLRRYFSFKNIPDACKVLLGFFQSFYILIKHRPALLISAGGFVSVPLHWAAALLGIPTWVHQQDFRPGLSNKLMAPFAAKITKSIDEVEFKKAEWIGNPVRNLKVDDISGSKRKFNIPDSAKVIFALGGGTGSAKINKMVLEALPSWPRNWHVIHLVGKERPRELQEKASGVFENYHVYQFLAEEMKDAYAVSDVVIGRAGFATITELAALKKPAILMPMFGTHQEDNTKLIEKNRAAIILNEQTDTGLKLAHIVSQLMNDEEKRRELGERLHTLLPPSKKEKIIEIVEMLRRNM